MRFFPIEQWPWHNNIVIDRGLNLFEDCAAGCVGKKSVPYFPGGTVKCTPLAPYQIHRQTGRQLKSKKKGCYQSNNFSGTRDTITYLKTCRVIYNNSSFTSYLSWCNFSCLKMYSEKSFNAYFYEQMFFEIFVAKGDTG